MVRRCLIEKKHFEQRPKGGQGVRKRENLLQAGETSAETELGRDPLCSRKQKNNVQGDREGDEVRKVMGATAYKPLQAIVYFSFSLNEMESHWSRAKE